jgi:hypothetical protein
MAQPFDEASPPSTPETKKEASTPNTHDSGSEEADVEQPQINEVKSDLNAKFQQEEEKEEVEEAPYQGCRRNKFIMCGFASITVVTILVMVIVLMMVKDSQENSTTALDGGDDLFVPITPVSPTPPVAPIDPIAPGAPVVTPIAPVVAPVPAPVPAPTPAPVAPTSAPTTPEPTASPTADLETLLVNFLQAQGIVVEFDDITPADQAVRWLLEEAIMADTELMFDDKLTQRFALLALDFAFQGNAADVVQRSGPLTNLGVQAQDECDWQGVTCVNDKVAELRFGSLELAGTIPTEISLLQNLTYLDISQNNLQGSIPEGLYDLVNLQSLYLYQNQLTGSISSSAGNWKNMIRLHLSQNQLTGSIPNTLRSGDSMKQFRK